MNDEVKGERERAVAILKGRLFDEIEAVEYDGGQVDERIYEAINGAVRDILGELAPVELFEDPGALIEAVRKLGITKETRKVGENYEVRWACATCCACGPWTTQSVLDRPVTHEHAATHTTSPAS